MRVEKILAVAGENLSQKCRNRLEELGFEVELLPAYKRLGKGVDTHADLMVFPLEDRIFTYRELSESLCDLTDKLRGRGYTVEMTDKIPSEKYPRDIALNFLQIGKYIFCNRKYASQEVLSYAESRGYTVVNVNQGYARCTACPVSDSGVISADPSMLSAADNKGIKNLSISVGSVVLEGFDYGFIGGSCGAFGNSLYFAGDLCAHPDGERIESFCGSVGVKAVSLSDEPLTDVGSIFFFRTLN